ncbi:MAG: hypothetical protein HYW96_00895 [Candidatus Wildermuthbacteria bacterium]|nr:hypothetical protein [Candidatus Wildermuthbacteria bacterium]
MIASLLLFSIFVIGVAAIIVTVLRKLGLDQKETFTLFLLATAAVVASAFILFLTSA